MKNVPCNAQICFGFGQGFGGLRVRRSRRKRVGRERKEGERETKKIIGVGEYCQEYRDH